METQYRSSIVFIVKQLCFGSYNFVNEFHKTEENLSQLSNNCILSFSSNYKILLAWSLVSQGPSVDVLI